MGEHPRGKILQRDPQGGGAETVNSSRQPAGVGPARVQVVPGHRITNAIKTAASRPTLSWEDPMEKEMAIHSSIIVWEILWTEEPGGLQSMGLQKSQT